MLLGLFVTFSLSDLFSSCNLEILTLSSLISSSKLEFVCDIDKVKNVLSKLRKVHPYEEPAIDIIPLLDERNFE